MTSSKLNSVTVSIIILVLLSIGVDFLKLLVELIFKLFSKKPLAKVYPEPKPEELIPEKRGEVNLDYESHELGSVLVKHGII